VHGVASESARVWLALSLLPGVGHSRLNRLRRLYPDPARLLEEPPGLLVQMGLPGDLARSLPMEAAAQELERVAASGARLLCASDPGFPRRLAEVRDGPCLQYVRGPLALDDVPAVALVGTRRATAAGRETARRLASELAAAGVVIVSGLARGIDTAAHEGALESGGRTAAVLGGGMLRPYPPENQELLGAIAGAGAVLSEYPMLAEPFLGAFLRRNRWIAALCDAAVVVEAPEGSGALRTARHARELGRRLLVVPGPIYDEPWAGSNRLLREGAELLLASSDVLAAVGVEPAAPPAEARPAALFPDPQQRVMDCLGTLPAPLDELVERSGLSAAEVRAALVALEMSGDVCRQPGPLFRRR
jgi:DNA processing protein